MATTGFWPVKGRLKDVINYAENPDKTTDRKYLDDDLAATLNYVENSDKTDQTMYVSGINCTKKRAYEQMMTTKRRFGKLGGNVAYHGYQSFQSGEVTPEEDYSLKEQCREITKKLTPLRKQLIICGRIENKVPRLRALIKQEKQLEQGRYKYKYYHQNKTKQRSYER